MRGLNDLGLGAAYAALGAAADAENVFERCAILDEEAAAGSSLRPLSRAWLGFQRGDLDEAYREGERMIRLGRSRGLSLDEARGTWIQAEVLRRRGELAEAEAAARAALANSVPLDRPVVLATLAATQLALGRVEDALSTAEEAMEVYRERGYCGHFFGTALLWIVHTDCLLAAGHRERACAAAADAHAWLERVALRIDDVHYRATFLDAVPEHRRIAELAEQLRAP